MRFLALSACVGLSALAWACGGDSESDGAGGTSSGGTSSGGTSSGGTSAGGTSAGGTSAGGAGGASGSGGGGGTTACGASLVCDASSVCIVDEKSAKCTALVDDAGTCPAGQTKSQCGGIGYPCCCGEAPPPVYECYTPTACGDVPTCDCVNDACEVAGLCTDLTADAARTFRCELPEVASAGR